MSGMRRIIPWTPELEQQVCELWMKGPAEWVAEQIGFPGKRSAILSRMKALGVTSPRRRGAGNTNAIKRNRKDGKISSPRDRPKSLDRSPKDDVTGPKAAEPNIPLAKLRRHHCKWPLWDDRSRPRYEDMLFCGARALTGSWCCAVHAQIAFTGGRRTRPEERAPRNNILRAGPLLPSQALGEKPTPE